MLKLADIPRLKVKHNASNQTVIAMYDRYKYPYLIVLIYIHPITSVLRGKCSSVKIHVCNKSVGPCRLPAQQLLCSR